MDARYGSPSDEGKAREYFIRITRREFWIMRVVRDIHFSGIPASVEAPMLVNYEIKWRG